jgi:integrase
MTYLGVKDVDQLYWHAREPKIIESEIIEWIVSLRQQQKLSHGLVNLYMSAIVKFYLFNDVVLNRKKIGSYLGENDRQHTDRAYTTEEISKLLNANADERMKALILLLASSGIRLGAVPSLNVSNLTKIEEYGLYKITVYERTSSQYICYCTPECAQAIDSYLQYRQRFGENLTGDSPLFRDRFYRDNMIRIKRPKRMNNRTPSNLLGEALLQAGLTQIVHEVEGKRHGTERKEVHRAMGFRKWYNTQMIRAKVNPVVKEMLMGHTTGLEQNYYRPDEEELLSEYIKGVDFLTINNEHRLQRQVAELTQKKDEIQVMKEKHDQEMKALRQEMNEQFSQIISMIQVNPKLAHIKPEALAEKIIQK